MNVHPDAPQEIKEKAKNRPCYKCGYPPKAKYEGDVLTTECSACREERPFFETW